MKPLTIIRMKKVLLMALMAIGAMSCSQNVEDKSHAQQPHAIGTYTRDSLHVCYEGKPMAVKDSASFLALGDGYARDDSTGYYSGKPFETEYPATLQSLGNGYAKDRFSAYYRGREIATAQASTFKVVGGDTAQDGMSTYVGGVQQYER